MTIRTTQFTPLSSGIDVPVGKKGSREETITLQRVASQRGTYSECHSPNKPFAHEERLVSIRLFNIKSKQPGIKKQYPICRNTVLMTDPLPVNTSQIRKHLFDRQLLMIKLDYLPQFVNYYVKRNSAREYGTEKELVGLLSLIMSLLKGSSEVDYLFENFKADMNLYHSSIKTIKEHIQAMDKTDSLKNAIVSGYDHFNDIIYDYFLPPLSANETNDLPGLDLTHATECKTVLDIVQTSFLAIIDALENLCHELGDHAVIKEYYEVVNNDFHDISKMLIDKGADPQARFKFICDLDDKIEVFSYLTTLQKAKQSNHRHLARLIKLYQDSSPEGYEAVRDELNSPIIKRLPSSTSIECDSKTVASACLQEIFTEYASSMAQPLLEIDYAAPDELKDKETTVGTLEGLQYRLNNLIANTQWLSIASQNKHSIKANAEDQELTAMNLV